MTDTVQAADPPQTNGIDAMDEDERAKNRPADIDADVREMERRKRVENIMNSRMFREELERIIETQMSEGTGTNSLMQQISDMMGVNKQAGGNFYKSSSCVLPINDIRGVEAMSYGKGEKILRCKLAAVYRLIDLCGWNQGISSLITARLNQDEEHFLVNPYGENTVNGDQSDAHMSTLSQSSKEEPSVSEGSPKKDKKKKKGLRTPSFLKKKKEKKREA